MNDPTPSTTQPTPRAPKKPSVKRATRSSKPKKDEPPIGKLKRKEYEKQMKHLHEELVKLQEWVVHTKAKICIVFEGRDGAGKGGTIKALTERVSPRIFRVVALPAPTEREKTQMHIQRYLPHFPAGGEVVIFDRSWYNRAGVERVMGFCSKEHVKRFLHVAPMMEKSIVDSNIILLKYWLEVSPEIQAERLEARIHDKRKTWKLSPMDVKSFTKWDDYTKARDDMLEATDTKFAPWFVARSDDKKQVRLDIISHIFSQIPYKKIPRKKVTLPKRSVKKDDPKKMAKRHVIPHVHVKSK